MVVLWPNSPGLLAFLGVTACSLLEKEPKTNMASTLMRESGSLLERSKEAEPSEILSGKGNFVQNEDLGASSIFWVLVKEMNLRYHDRDL